MKDEDGTFLFETRALYDKIASQFDRSRGTRPWQPLVRFLEGREESLSLQRGATIACLGCGNGRNIAAFISLAKNSIAIGVDTSRELLEIARPRVPIPTSLIEASFTDLPLRRASMDLATAISSLQHVPLTRDVARAFDEMAGVLVGRGLAVISFWRKWQRQHAAKTLASYLTPRPGLVEVPWTDSKTGEVHRRHYLFLGKVAIRKLATRKFEIMDWQAGGGKSGRDNHFLLLEKQQD